MKCQKTPSAPLPNRSHTFTLSFGQIHIMIRSGFAIITTTRIWTCIQQLITMCFSCLQDRELSISTCQETQRCFRQHLRRSDSVEQCEKRYTIWPIGKKGRKGGGVIALIFIWLTRTWLKIYWAELKRFHYRDPDLPKSITLLKW